MDRLQKGWTLSRSASEPQLLPTIILESKSAATLKHSASMRRIHSRGNLRSPSKNRRLLRLLAIGMTVLLGLHVVSAVMTGLSLLGPNSADLSDLIDLIGDGMPASTMTYSSEADDVPKLIPRIIHQTYKTRQVPDIVQKYMNTWRDMNPGWDIRFYDDQDCIEFVRREFPEYLDAYRRLRNDVERSDFFRYMVVLRLGGVYADIDTECRVPLDSIVRSRDTLIVGWENEFIDAQHAVEAWYVRTRQVLQWVFAGAPTHPALREVCDRIAASVKGKTSFSSDPNLDILERTGPGVFTDVVMKHANLHPPSDRDDPWNVRILPRVVFGAPRKPAYGLTPRGEGVAVQHAFLGSWRLERRWWLFWKRSSVEEVANQVSRWWHYRSDDVIADQVARLEARHDEERLFPVSADFDPPFDIMTHLTSHGEKHSGWDVSHALTAHGSWQPSVQPYRKPSLAEALVGSLGAPTSREAGQARVLIDIGAGYGYVSLAAAARGHKVHAFELGPKSLEALEAAVERNGFDHLVQLHRVPLGAANQEDQVCLQHSSNDSTSVDPEEVARGYAAPAAHVVNGDCMLSVPRLPLTSVLPEDDIAGAVRISANGWEGLIIDGMVPLLEQQRPTVISVEWNPAAMKVAGYDQPLKLIETLTALGYDDVSHSGFVCDERWYAVTYGIRRRGGVLPEELAALKQPTWCHLNPEDYSLLLERSSSTYPETLLFINKAAGGVEHREAKHDGSVMNSKKQQQQKDSGGVETAAKTPGAGPVLVDKWRAKVASKEDEERLPFALTSSTTTTAATADSIEGGSVNNQEPSPVAGMKGTRGASAASVLQTAMSALHLGGNDAATSNQAAANGEDANKDADDVLADDPAAGDTAQAVSDLTSGRVSTLRSVGGRRGGAASASRRSEKP